MGILKRFIFWIVGVLIPTYDLYLKPLLPVDRRPELGFAGELGPVILVGGLVVAATLTFHDLRMENQSLSAASDIARAAIDTQVHLGSISRNGSQLLGRLNAYRAYEGDDVAAQFWQAQVQLWTDWADRIIVWRLPHLREAFAKVVSQDVV